MTNIFKKNKGILPAVGISLIFLCAFFIREIFFTHSIATIDDKQIDKAIVKGLKFLNKKQKKNYFYNSYCKNPSLSSGCRKEVALYPNAQIAFSLLHLHTDRSSQILQRLKAFFIQQKTSLDLWAYYAAEDVMHKKIPPDLDDTSLVSYFLQNYTNTNRENNQLFLQNRNKDGFFYTWFSVPEKKNNIDCAVNANVLMYLSSHGNYSNKMYNLVDWVLKSNFKCSLYHLNPINILYTIARAFYHSKIPLRKQDKTLFEQLSSISENAIFKSNANDLCLATSSMIYIKDTKGNLKGNINSILHEQKPSGAFNKYIYYINYKGGMEHYFGSEMLSTAICLETLALYKKEVVKK